MGDGTRYLSLMHMLSSTLRKAVLKHSVPREYTTLLSTSAHGSNMAVT